MVEPMEVEEGARPEGEKREEGSRDVLYIPSLNSDLTVVLPWEDMKDAELVVDLFKAEEAPLTYWIDAARVYYNKGMKEQYLIMLKELTSDDVGEHYGNSGKLQRVQAFCALAEAKIEETKSAKTPEEKASCLVAAENYLTSAAAIDRTRGMTEHWITNGKLELAKEDYTRAKKCFENALLPEFGGEVNCSGHLGCAYCCFRQRKFTEALGHYGKILRALGSERCPNYVRLAMAACYLQLKRHDMAERCYERVAQLDDSSAEAKAGLGALKVLSKNKEDLEGGLALLKAAYELNPHLAFNLVSICEQLFNRGEYNVVAKLAQAVIESDTHESSIKAEAYYYLGMVYYLADQSDQALMCFRSAKAEDKDYIFPNHGMAKVFIKNGNVQSATIALEAITEASQGDLEVLINLSVLYKAQGEVQKAVQYAQRALAIDKKNVLLEEYLANLLAGLDSKKALEHYSHVMDRKGKGFDSEKSSLLMINNTGVMHYRCGHHDKALVWFGKALKLAENTVYSFPIRYNIARSHEALGSLQKASHLYKQLLSDVPGYLECTLRLAAVCFSMGYEDKAIKYCVQGLSQYESSAECLAMLIWISLARGKSKDAHRYIREMDKKCPNEHDFTQTALGGMYLQAAFKESRAGNKEGNQKQLNNALTMFKQAVTTSPRNMFAALGMGVCLALLGESLVAKKIFDKILDASKQDIKIVDMPEAWQNKASINLENGHYQDAWKTYHYCQRTFHLQKNVEISNLMAQALNAAGNKKEATALLLQTIHHEPTSLPSKYCLAVVLMGHAHEIIHRPETMENDKRVHELDFAIGRLELAAFFIDYLFELKNNKEKHVELDINRASLKDLKKNLTLMRDKAERTRRNVETYMREKQKADQEYEEEVEIARLELKQQENEERLQREAEEREREAVAQRNAEKLAALQEKWATRPGKRKMEEEDGKGSGGGGKEKEEEEPSPWSTDLLGDPEESDKEGDDEKEKGGEEGEEKEKKVYKPPSKRKKMTLESDSES